MGLGGGFLVCPLPPPPVCCWRLFEDESAEELFICESQSMVVRLLSSAAVMSVTRQRRREEGQVHTSAESEPFADSLQYSLLGYSRKYTMTTDDNALGSATILCF